MVFGMCGAARGRGADAHARFACKPICRNYFQSFTQLYVLSS